MRDDLRARLDAMRDAAEADRFSPPDGYNNALRNAYASGDLITREEAEQRVARVTDAANELMWVIDELASEGFMLDPNEQRVHALREALAE